jgi:Tannase and feruloyl esterase
MLILVHRLVIFATLLAAAALPSLAGDCQSMMNLTLPETTITAAQPVAAGEWPAGNSAAKNPPFCRVAATLKPTSDSHIQIEVWMPEQDWNGKFQAVGNGGWSGSIVYNALLAAIRRGYASSSTDTGHTGGSASFALGHPEKLIDYAYRSEHEMAVKAKAIVAAYYGREAAHSYWNGCSAGGKQALKEAQRYPEDFDGIIAGAPAANWTGRAVQSLYAAVAVHKDEAGYIPAAKYPMIHAAVLAECDAIDGVTDGVLEDPRRCHFEPKTLECKGGDAANCLTAAQVEAARKIYGPSLNPRTKKPLYPGLERGSEPGWATWAGPRPLAIGLDYFRYVVLEDPNWDFRTLDFDRDVAKAEKLDANRINALDPNLKPFFARGGKLIQYHGWNDPQISPGNSVDYYNSVLHRMGKVEDSYRLFMVPGMGHCGGGDGTSTFDMLSALEQWVEGRKAPERIAASRVRNGKIDRTRPLCPYPQVAVYQGHGSTDDEASFACGAAGR